MGLTLVFSLVTPSEVLKSPSKSRLLIKKAACLRAKQWQKLIGTNGINTRADLAKYLGVSRARVTQVLSKVLVGPVGL